MSVMYFWACFNAPKFQKEGPHTTFSSCHLVILGKLCIWWITFIIFTATRCLLSAKCKHTKVTERLAIAFPVSIIFFPILSYLGLILHCPSRPVLSCLLCWSRGDTERCRDQVLQCVDSQCHCAQWEDKDSIEEAGMEQGAAQDTLTDWAVFVPSSPFIHTTDSVFSFSPLPALSCLALVFSLPFPLPPLFFLFGVGWLALKSASRVKIRGQDSRESKNRLGHLRPLSNSWTQKGEGGKNLKVAL